MREPQRELSFLRGLNVQAVIDVYPDRTGTKRVCGAAANAVSTTGRVGRSDVYHMISTTIIDRTQQGLVCQTDMVLPTFFGLEQRCLTRGGAHHGLSPVPCVVWVSDGLFGLTALGGAGKRFALFPESGSEIYPGAGRWNLVFQEAMSPPFPGILGGEQPLVNPPKKLNSNCGSRIKKTIRVF